MHEMENGYVPLENAVGSRSTFKISLPDYVDKDAIGVNLRRTDHLAKLGGISHIQVKSVNGETSNSVPAIVGINRNGEGLAGKTSLKTEVDQFTVESEKTDRLSIPHSGSWINTTITLNTNEIEDRIAKNDKWERGIRSAEAWAYHLNQSVSTGVTNSGTEHLTLGLSRLNWVKTLMQYGIMASFELQNNPTPEGMLSRVLFVSQFLNLIDMVSCKAQGVEFRYSAFYGPQLDRAIVLWCAAKATNLIKSFPEDE